MVVLSRDRRDEWWSSHGTEEMGERVHSEGVYTLRGRVYTLGGRVHSEERIQLGERVHSGERVHTARGACTLS